ncbi:non-SMC condensin II complex subunit D3 [Phyllostomus discolor]|uniref:Non-SMC condensin II complex subunit D3 n=1 Tax=Phyllostomus discolor TaxID=89673 RepID=A0A833YZR8_9CHIR|nr:non-SMC condensin II complex subunit D3 [Phyllostomus discolor]
MHSQNSMKAFSTLPLKNMDLQRSFGPSSLKTIFLTMHWWLCFITSFKQSTRKTSVCNIENMAFTPPVFISCY